MAEAASCAHRHKPSSRGTAFSAQNRIATAPQLNLDRPTILGCHELVLNDQSKLRKRQPGGTTPRTILTHPVLELLNGLSQIHRARASRSSRPGLGARHEVLLVASIVRSKGFHLIRPRCGAGHRHLPPSFRRLLIERGGIGSREV